MFFSKIFQNEHLRTFAFMHYRLFFRVLILENVAHLSLIFEKNVFYIDLQKLNSKEVDPGISDYKCD